MTTPLGLSYSSIDDLLHLCPRKFELVKLLRAVEGKEENLDLGFGSAIGAGIQELFHSGSLVHAIWKAFTIWTCEKHMDLDYSNKKKSFSILVKHLEKLHASLPNELHGWELWYFEYEGKKLPAIEVGFLIRLNENYTYRGFIDIILYHPVMKKFTVVEIKSDGQTPTPAKYQNSFQGESYTLLLERIVGLKRGDIADAVKYLVCYCPSIEQICYEFPKNPVQKLDWLVSLSMDVQDIEMYKTHGYFPKRGKACYQYYRPCIFLGLCDLKSLGHRKPDGTYLDPEVEDEKKYHFHFTLEELLSNDNV